MDEDLVKDDDAADDRHRHLERKSERQNTRTIIIFSLTLLSYFFCLLSFLTLSLSHSLLLSRTYEDTQNTQQSAKMLLKMLLMLLTMMMMMMKEARERERRAVDDEKRKRLVVHDLE